MSKVPEDLRAALADRYELEREIGRGGMATVYLARDVKHGRNVAVKVMRPDLAASLGSDRFLREIEIAAKLQHPHILTLIDSGEREGFLHYVMPYVDGESLRDRLVREKRMEPGAAIPIVKQVADALSYAHRNGVVHRDIKPENILFSQGHPVVTDFGIAKAVSTAGPEHLTRTGFPIGTPGYMSPEQAAGSTDLDAKTDVYSLAAVVYEMLIGEPVGTWVTDDSVELLHFVDAPPRHREKLDRMSAAVEQALVRALSLRRRHRFATPSEFAEALDSRGDRKYRHTEAKEILKRAANNEALAPPAETGALSLAGVERIGAEAGIPALQVREAVGMATRPEFQPKPSKFLGAPTVISFERVVEGELPEEDFPLLIEEIRITLKNVGSINTYGKSLTWQTQRDPNVGGRDVHVMVTVRGGQTRIRVEEKIGALAGGLFGGIMGGGGGGGGTAVFGSLFAFVGPPVAALGFLAWVGGMYGLARTIFTGVANKRGYELRNLADRLAELVKDFTR
jgi:serine/threonine protein kinase